MVQPARSAKFAKVASNRQAGIIVVLEDIHDPHNAAAILRSCDAFGVQKVCFIFEQEKSYNPKKVGKSSSSSANKWLDFEVFKSTKACFAKLKKSGYEIVVTVCDENVESIFNSKLSAKKLALVIGNEHRGVSPLAVKLAKRRIYIPMQGMVQSLNASVTAGICLFEIVRQRQRSGEKYLLNKSEQKKLISSFKKR